MGAATAMCVAEENPRVCAAILNDPWMDVIESQIDHFSKIFWKPISIINTL